MSSSLLDLESLLDYEVRCSTRYRRTLCLLFVVPVNTSADLENMIRDVFRSSDEFFEFRSRTAILMSETDCTEALTAIDRYKGACGEDVDLRFAVASFPVDGQTTSEIVTTAQRRLNQALKLDRGAVVAAG